jgi:ABC-type phosphate transport system substrate-binding protein
MKRMSTRATWFAIAALLLLASGPRGTAHAADGYKVIVHPANPVSSLPREQVSRYFLKKATNWKAGGAVAPVDRDRDAAPRAAFSREVLHKSVAEVTAYWQQQFFSGRGVPPAEKRTDADVVAFVTANPGAIGYVAQSAEVGDAKVIEVE